MNQLILTIAAILGGMAVIFGAFGAHYLKSRMNAELLKSFETGVKYQMYHALLLLIIGFNFNFHTSVEVWAAWSVVLGVLLFSFSIYGLCLSSAKGKKLKFLGPVTPMGGMLLVAGWFLLVIHFLNL